MKEFYTRGEICNLFHPPVSRHYLRTLEGRGKMPKPEKKTALGYVYQAKKIDEWMSKGVEKEKTGRKLGARQERMSNQDFDPWNLRKNKENIEYTEEMTMLIKFLQPGLKNRNLGNALGS
jgi:hypothetical protein